MHSDILRDRAGWEGRPQEKNGEQSRSGRGTSEAVWGEEGSDREIRTQRSWRGKCWCKAGTWEDLTSTQGVVTG